MKSTLANLQKPMWQTSSRHSSSITELLPLSLTTVPAVHPEYSNHQQLGSLADHLWQSTLHTTMSHIKQVSMWVRFGQWLDHFTHAQATTWLRFHYCIDFSTIILSRPTLPVYGRQQNKRYTLTASYQGLWKTKISIIARDWESSRTRQFICCLASSSLVAAFEAYSRVHVRWYRGNHVQYRYYCFCVR